MQCRHTKHFCLCGETVFLLSFPLLLIPWRMYIAVNITAQQHMILSFFSSFLCRTSSVLVSHLFLQYSVPRTTFKDFCVIRLGRLSALEDRRAKNWNQRLKAVWSSWGRHSNPSHHQGDLWGAVNSPVDLHAGGAKDIIIVRIVWNSITGAPEWPFWCRYWHFGAPECFLRFRQGPGTAFRLTFITVFRQFYSQTNPTDISPDRRTIPPAGSWVSQPMGCLLHTGFWLLTFTFMSMPHFHSVVAVEFTNIVNFFDCVDENLVCRICSLILFSFSFFT